MHDLMQLSAWRDPVAVQHIHSVGNTSCYNAKHGNLISVDWNESSNSRSLYSFFLGNERACLLQLL